MIRIRSLLASPLALACLVTLSMTGCPKEASVDENRLPSAAAGDDITAVTGDLVQLDGSGSSDPEGAAVEYRWSFEALPAGSSAQLNDTSVVNPSFVPDVAGTFVVRLVVHDGQDPSAPDVVSVSVTADPTGNQAPLADAGSAQSVSTGAVVSLDGSASTDPDGDPLTFAWSFLQLPPGSQAAINDAGVLQPSFLADVDGTYRVLLLVSDGRATGSATVDITSSSANVAPVAAAGADRFVRVGEIVKLDGSGSLDADGDPLTFAWTLNTQPAGSAAILLGETTATPTFVADLAGDFVLELIVSDATTASAPSQITVVATEANVRPVADAGVDQSVNLGELVQLSAAGSSDANGDALTYTWWVSAAPTGSTAALSATDVVDPTFTPDLGGSYAIQLQVNDGQADSSVDTLVIQALVPNLPPVADAGPDIYGIPGLTQVVLDASASFDPEGEALFYQWWFVLKPTGSTVQIADPNFIVQSFVPDLAGEYRIYLRVDDGTYTHTDVLSVFVEDECCIALVQGDAQTDAVGTTLPVQAVWEVTNQYGIVVPGVPVNTAITTGTASLSPTAGFTDLAGQFTSDITLGTVPGDSTLEATCASCATTGTAGGMVTAVHGPPAAVILSQPADVTAPGPMVITATVVDQYGNIVTTDDTTSFTITSSGSATFSGTATSGTVNTGGGTNAVMVTVSGGVATIDLSDTLVEAVTIDLVDSEATGLSMGSASGSTVTATLPAQALLPDGGTTTLTFDLTILGQYTPTGDGTLTLWARGDFDSTFEDFNVYMESTAGDFIGVGMNTVGITQCGAAYTASVFTIPQVSLMGYTADGFVGVQLITDTGVDAITCSNHSVWAELSYPSVVTANFL